MRRCPDPAHSARLLNAPCLALTPVLSPPSVRAPSAKPPARRRRASQPEWPRAASRAGKEQKAAIEKLPEKYRDWLETVDLLITDEERATFLALDKDYQRDAFIKRFWEVRDPYKRTARNEFQERWEANVAAGEAAASAT